MEKQPACAAPTNSSGFVPGPVAKREAWVNGPSYAPSPTFIVPAPSFNVPFHSADDILTDIFSSLSKVNWIDYVYLPASSWQVVLLLYFELVWNV
jgi:hypothetical protein